MPNVVRFALPSAQNLSTPVGTFTAGYLDIDPNNSALLKRARFALVQYQAKELGVVASNATKPTLPVPSDYSAPVVPDPYPQYLTLAEVIAEVNNPASALVTALKNASTT